MDLLAIIFRRGWRTSEFWVTLAGLALAAWLRSGTALLGITVSVGCYSLSRGLLKGSAARAILARERNPLALVDDAGDKRHASERSRLPRV